MQRRPWEPEPPSIVTSVHWERATKWGTSSRCRLKPAGPRPLSVATYFAPHPSADPRQVQSVEGAEDDVGTNPGVFALLLALKGTRATCEGRSES
jgi:hypothetical protein